MRLGGVSLADAIEMASLRPAKLIGLDHAGLEVGALANLMLFRLPASDTNPLDIAATLHRGEAANLHRRETSR
jgi:dihydroorotase-like cyclic amidohydrolase